MFTNKAVLDAEDKLVRCRHLVEMLAQKDKPALLRLAQKTLAKARMAHFEALKQAELKAYAIEEKRAFDLWVSDKRFSNADFFPSPISVLYWLRANPELA